MINKANLKTCVSISIFLLAIAGPAQAATITVGSGAGYDFDTIQAGIDAAVDGDTVLVAPGEYIITEPITFRDKAITVMSEAGSDETTIRMGTPADINRGSVVVFENNETDASVLDGFTITGGTGCRLWRAEAHGGPEFNWDGGGLLFNASSGTVQNCAIVQNRVEDAGGGVVVISGSSAILTNCIISENSAPNPDESGGGVSCAYDSSVTMTYCIIRDNSTRAVGGGVSCWHGSLTMIHCTIMGNMAQKCGAGVYVGRASATLTNCLIFRNTAGIDWGGGGVICSYPGASLTIHNCTICGNSAGDWDWGGGGVLCRQASATITNSIICANTAPKGREISVQDAASTLNITYSNVAGGQPGVSVEGGCMLDWGPGNIDADPLFADPKNDDYHLKSQAGRWDPNSQTWVLDDVTSLCIDGGDQNSDWTAELWPYGERINMGAYGGTSQASRSLSDAGNVADLNRDGIVDSADMRIMVDHWGTGEPLCDIGPMPWGDGIVDVQDLIVLAEHLFEEFPPVEPAE